MKIIDLLNKIANGEELPKKIRYISTTKKIRHISTIYELNDVTGNYYEESKNTHYENNLYYQLYSAKKLNDEIEIIEEQEETSKKIEKITEYTTQVGRVDETCIEDYIHTLFEQQSSIIYRLNKIIDYINEMEDK